MNYIKGLSGLSKVKENIHFISDHVFFDNDIVYERGFSSNEDMIEDFTIK